MDSLKVKVSFTSSMLELRGFMKLGRFSGEDLDIYSWWNILAAKFTVSVIMDLMADMATNVKRTMRQNAFVMPFSLLYFSLITFLCCNPEMWKFAYSGIRREDSEGMP